jgi:ABC-type uncharacterized transport system YnjBCD permease subunit
MGNASQGSEHKGLWEHMIWDFPFLYAVLQGYQTTIYGKQPMKFSWFLWELLGMVVSRPLLLWFLQPPVRRLQVLKEKRLEGAKQVNQVVCLEAIWFPDMYLSTEMLIMFQAQSFNGFLDFVVRLGFPGE